jgi:hypothetical protein
MKRSRLERTDKFHSRNRKSRVNTRGKIPAAPNGPGQRIINSNPPKPIGPENQNIKAISINTDVLYVLLVSLLVYFLFKFGCQLVSS